MSAEDIKRKLTAIFSADVEGYSRLMEGDELATVQTLTSYKETMRKQIKHYRGRVVDSTGDNLLAEFPSVVDAVQCAVEVQQIVKGKNEDLPENRRMLFRIGINLGDVLEEGDRIFGDGVNIAARIESMADGGGICISGTAYDQIKNKLALAYNYLGEHSVKNISEPVRVYKVPMDPRDVGKRRAAKPWKKAAIAAAVILILAGGALGIWHYYFRPPPIEPASVEKMAYPLPDKPSIAVLPFVNMSGDPEQEYIADGITENITTVLSKIPEMFVIARTSAMTYKGKPVTVKQVSEELGVRYVLEGSVQKEGDRVRITAQLVDTIKGNHLWAERYDRDMKGFFDLLDEITKEIGAALQVQLTWGDYASSISSTVNLEAWGYFNKGVSHFNRYTKRDNIKARELCERAAKLDPEYVPPLRIIAYTYLMDIRFGWSKSPRQSMERAIELAQNALRIDDSDAGVHSLLAYIYLLKRQHEKSIDEAERAINLDPNFAIGYSALADTMIQSGRYEEAIAMIKTAMRLHGPYFPAYFWSYLAESQRGTERFEEAISAYENLLDRCLKGEYPLILAHAGLAGTYMEAGQEEKARAHAAEVLKIKPSFSLDSVRKLARFKNQADLDRVIDALRKAGIPEKPPVAVPEKPSIAVLPFANIGGDPKEDYLCDGITEQIITALSRTPKLFVIASNSTFTYKGKPVKIQQVRKDLGVRYVLEGSVQKSGDRLRITAQLIDAITGNHLWADKYDRQLKDIFSLQDDISRNVVMALQIKLTEGEYARIYGSGTDNLEALLKAMRGMHHVLRFNKNDNEIARKYYEEAIVLDPEYPNVYTLLAWTYRHEAFYGWTKTPEKSRKKAIELAKHAISLDDTNAIPHMVFALVYVEMGQFEKALSAGEKGFSLEPNNADVNFLYGYTLLNSGLFQEAVEKFKKALQLSPINPYFNAALSKAYFALGEYERAIEAAKKQLKTGVFLVRNYLRIAASYFLLGSKEKAQEAIKQILKINPKFSLEPYAKFWLNKPLHPKYRKVKEIKFDAVRKAGLK